MKHSGKSAQYDILEDSEQYTVKLKETALEEEVEMLSSQMSGLGSDISEQIEQISSQVSELSSIDTVQPRISVAMIAEGLDKDDDDDGLPGEGGDGVLPGRDVWDGDGVAVGGGDGVTGRVICGDGLPARGASPPLWWRRWWRRWRRR